MLVKACLLVLAAPSLVQVDGRHHHGSHHYRKTVSKLPRYTVREARLENVKVQMAQEEARNAMQLVQRHHHHGHHHNLRKRSLANPGVEEVRAFATEHMKNEMRTKQEIRAEIAKVMHTTDPNAQKIKAEIKDVERHMANHHHTLSHSHGHHHGHHAHHAHHHGHHHHAHAHSHGHHGTHHHGHHAHHAHHAHHHGHHHHAHAHSHGHHGTHHHNGHGHLHKRAAMPFIDFDHALHEANNLQTLAVTVTETASATPTATHDLADTHYDYHAATSTVTSTAVVTSVATSTVSVVSTVSTATESTSVSVQTVTETQTQTQSVVQTTTSTLATQTETQTQSTVQTLTETATQTQTVVEPSVVFVPGQPRPDHRCGPQFGDSPCHTGECCGEHGFCGTSAEHCAGRCQPAFGRCDESIAVIPGTTDPREDNRCGPDFGKARCHFGECCSKFGHCGITSDHCSEASCHQEFGQCAFPVNGLPAVSTITATATATVTQVVSTLTTVVPSLTATTVTPTLTATSVIPTLTASTVITSLTATSVIPTLTATTVTTSLSASTVLPPVTITSSTVTNILVPTEVFIPGQPRPDHRCGVDFGDAPCHEGECCGEEGHCGLSLTHCAGRCQAAFGRCDESVADIAGTTRPREDSRCGPSHGNARCHFGECCSSFGYCGKFEAHCAKDRCLEPFGQCAYEVDGRPAVTPITVVFPEDAPLVFVDGQPRPDHRCGVLFGDSPCNTGECCGEEGFCGTSTQHCSGGCQTPFGRCDSTSAVIPGTTYPREDNRCGPDFGNARCHYGECCSKFGHCGKLTDHCDADFCDTKFGQCAFPVNGLSAVVPITVVHEAFTPTLTSVQVVAPTLTSTKVLTTSVVTVVTQTLVQDIPVASQQLADTTVTSSVVNVAVTQTVSTAGIASTVVQDQPLTQEEELIKACPMEFGTDAFFDCKHLFYQNHAAATFDPVTDCSTVAIASETIAANLPEATQAVQLEVSNEDAEEEEALEEEEEATADELAQEDEVLFEGEGPSERELVEAQAQSYSGDATKVSQAPLLTLVLAVAGLMLM